MTLQEKLAEIDPDIVMADGWDKAFIGVINTDEGWCAVYDADVIIEELVERDGMSHEDAVEFFEFNIAGAHGVQFPKYLQRVA